MLEIPLLEKIKEVIIQPLLSLLFIFALLVFIWGVADYIRGAADATKRTDGRNHMIWGLIGMFIMASAVGILQMVCLTIECN